MEKGEKGGGGKRKMQKVISLQIDRMQVVSSYIETR